MDTLATLLDAVRERAGSDRKAAPLLGVSQVAVSAWRTGRAFPDDAKAERIAELLQLDGAYVLAVINAERTKSATARATWHRIAQAFGKAAMLAALAVAPTLHAPDVQAGKGAGFDNKSASDRTGIRIANKRRRRSSAARALAQAAPRWCDAAAQVLGMRRSSAA